MGALDGITFSNSHVFHEAKHWSGVLIELNPDNYSKLIVNRPPSSEQAVVNAGVCDTKQTLHYFSSVDIMAYITKREDTKTVEVEQCRALWNSPLIPLLKSIGRG